MADGASYFLDGATVDSTSTTNNSISVRDSKRRPRFGSDVNQVYAFPRLLTVRRCHGRAESYCRSLLLERHGFPLYHPTVAIKKGSIYLEKGINIGDVGFIWPGGSFRFFFNIFLPVDDPIHAGKTPTEFKPIEPPHDSEVKFIPDYFKPGTIITSEGIKVVKHSAEPL